MDSGKLHELEKLTEDACLILDKLELPYRVVALSSGGAPVPLNQVCNINMNEDSSVIISPYDENSIDDIIKGIQKSDLGFNPSVDKSVIIINVPPMIEKEVKFKNKFYVP